jgi:hypothetical protein
MAWSFAPSHITSTKPFLVLLEIFSKFWCEALGVQYRLKRDLVLNFWSLGSLWEGGGWVSVTTRLVVGIFEKNP